MLRCDEQVVGPPMVIYLSGKNQRGGGGFGCGGRGFIYWQKGKNTQELPSPQLAWCPRV